MFSSGARYVASVLEGNKLKTTLAQSTEWQAISGCFAQIPALLWDPHRLLFKGYLNSFTAFKPLVCEANRSPLSSAEKKKSGSIPALPQTSSGFST